MNSQGSRTILAVVVSMGVLMLYYAWFAPKQQPQQPAQKPTPAQVTPTQSPAPVESDKTVKTQPTVQPSIEPQEEQIPVKEIIFENDSIYAVLSTRGGVFTQWKLKHYHQKAEDKAVNDSPLTDLLSNGKSGIALKLDLGPQVPNDFVYNVDVQEATQVVLSRRYGDLQIQKTIILNEAIDPHLLDIQVSLTNMGDKPLVLDPALGVSRPQKVIKKKSGIFSFLRGPTDTYNPAVYIDGKLEIERNWEKLPQKTQESGKIYWSGLTDRYFLISLISRQSTGNIINDFGKTNQGEVYSTLSYGTLTLQPGETTQRLYSAYFGPKKREELKKLGSNLETAVDYGWFSIVAIPLLWLLIFFQKIVVNWGLAIIALTFFVKLLLHPINKKAMTSMKAMQKLQPKLKEIREKYKGNKERLNQEMMSLFKINKVNPMGGCLPMVLQMPVYIALYKVLWNSIELYQAPFFWFYTDLSAPDPYMVSPILLGIFMALQQKLTPNPSADPAQARMMMLMPLMFVAFMIFLPSGLVIYIFVNTVVSVIQQYMIHREINFWDLIKKLRPSRKAA